MEKILISACLLGDPVRYDGKAKTIKNDLLSKWQAEGRLVPLCPEVAGGLPTPRPPAEINHLDGRAILAKDNGGVARVLTQAGEDVTGPFVKGAEIALDLCKQHQITVAILTAKSPSCGSREIYDGAFSGNLKEGVGVTSALLVANGVEVFDQFSIENVRKKLGEG